MCVTFLLPPGIKGLIENSLSFVWFKYVEYEVSSTQGVLQKKYIFRKSAELTETQLCARVSYNEGAARMDKS